MLVEALMAVALLAIGAIIAGGIINRITATTALSANYLIANNLMIEASEAIKGLQYTNILNKPNSPECWLTIDTEIAEDDCNQTINKVTPNTNYRLVVKNNGAFMIQEAQGNTDLDLSIGTDNLYEQYLLYLDKDPLKPYNRYIELPLPSSSPTINQEKTAYYRNIKFIEVTADSAELQINIQWREGRKMRSIQDTVFLTNI